MIADFRKLFPKLAHQPEQKRRIESAGLCTKRSDASTLIVPLPSGTSPQQFFKLERGLAEKAVSAVHLQLQLLCAVALRSIAG